MFLIDDFSTHRVPTAVQEALHDVVWLRASSHSFKLSAEKNGVHIATHGGRTAELAREYTEVDCGSIMLEEAGFGGCAWFKLSSCWTCDSRRVGMLRMRRELLGRSEWQTTGPSKSTEFLWEFAHSGRKGQKPAAYYGTECIADLCSGDVAALLLIYENIFRKGKVNAATTKQVRAAFKVALSSQCPASW